MNPILPLSRGRRESPLGLRFFWFYLFNWGWFDWGWFDWGLSDRLFLDLLVSDVTESWLLSCSKRLEERCAYRGKQVAHFRGVREIGIHLTLALTPHGDRADNGVSVIDWANAIAVGILIDHRLGDFNFVHDGKNV